MDQSFKSLACQETPRILHIPKVIYPLNNSLTLVPVLSQTYPVYALPSYYLMIHYNVILPSSLRLPSGLLFLRFRPPNLCMYFTCPERATRPTNLILLVLITRLIFVKQYGP